MAPCRRPAGTPSTIPRAARPAWQALFACALRSSAGSWSGHCSVRWLNDDTSPDPCQALTRPVRGRDERDSGSWGLVRPHGAIPEVSEAVPEGTLAVPPPHPAGSIPPAAGTGRDSAGAVTERTHAQRRGGRTFARSAAAARRPASLRWCPERDSNSHRHSPTTPSRWRVYQFHHPGTYVICDGRGASRGARHPSPTRSQAQPDLFALHRFFGRLGSALGRRLGSRQLGRQPPPQGRPRRPSSAAAGRSLRPRRPSPRLRVPPQRDREASVRSA